MSDHEAEARRVAEEIRVLAWARPSMFSAESLVGPLLAFAKLVRGPFERLRAECKGCHGTGVLEGEAGLACDCEGNLLDMLQTWGESEGEACRLKGDLEDRRNWTATLATKMREAGAGEQESMLDFFDSLCAQLSESKAQLDARNREAGSLYLQLCDAREALSEAQRRVRKLEQALHLILDGLPDFPDAETPDDCGVDLRHGRLVVGDIRRGHAALSAED